MKRVSILQARHAPSPGSAAGHGGRAASNGVPGGRISASLDDRLPCGMRRDFPRMTTPLPAFRPLDRYDWPRIAQDLDAQGWALLPALFAPDDARRMARAAIPASEPGPGQMALSGIDWAHAAASSMDLAQLAELRAGLYERLLPVARAWAAALGQEARYPDDEAAGTQRNRQAGQSRGLSAIQRLRTDDYLPLRHADGERVFPLRLIALLSEPGRDFTGGETVMTEQRPRMQSRPMVLPLGLGDAAVIAVSHRPVRGAHGVYRVTDRQAVSRVRSGERFALELTLHEAA